jgi:hypothetical protein
MNTSNDEWLKLAEEMDEQFANVSAFLEGRVAQFVNNGWTDREARTIVFKLVFGS